MIVKINPDCFFSNNKEILESLSEIMRDALKRRFLLDTSNIIELFEVIEQTIWYKNHLSNVEQNQLKDTLDEIEKLNAYITELHIKYLNIIVIGIERDQINPIEAANILNQPSNIIMENQVNDFKFIEGLVEKYSNHKKRKTIYKLLKQAIEKKWLVPDNAGGKGEIKKIVLEWINRHGQLYKLKIITVFDSDRTKAE